MGETLLTTFRTAPLLDAYALYQHFMDYWAATMQDDCYLIAAEGWQAGAQPREIRQVKNKDGKMVWPEAHDYTTGKRRFKSDLVPAALLVARYFTAEQNAIEMIESEISALEQQLDEIREEQSGEEGLLAEVIEGEGEKQSAILRAEGDAQARVLRAQGEAEAIQKVFDAIHAGDADAQVLAYQYIQALPTIANGTANKVWVVPAELTKAMDNLGTAFLRPPGGAPEESPLEPEKPAVEG